MGLIYRLLKRRGIVFHRVPTSNKSIKLAPSEVRELDRALLAFSTATGHDTKGWRKYLTKERLLFFHEIVSRCKELHLLERSNEIGDIGFGTGYLLKLLAAEDIKLKVFGYETFDQAFDLAAELVPNAILEKKSLYEVDRHHDLVFCTEVMEHLVDPARALHHMMGTVRIGGALFLTVPNGRFDHQSAGEIREDGSAYWGHVNFWSDESWHHFLVQTLGAKKRLKTGPIGGDKLFAAIWQD